MGVTFAGIAAAGSAAMIAKIAGVNPGSGGGAASVSIPSGGGGGGDIGGAAAAPVQNAQQHSMIVSGIGARDLFTGTMVKDLAEKLLAFQRDGGKVVLE